jgi:hypothetical protein
LKIKKKEKERKKEKGEMARGLMCPIGCVTLGFSQLLGAINSCFKI